MTHALPGEIEMTPSQFDWISKLVKDLCGINLHDGKMALVKARLGKRLRLLGLRDFKEYVDYLRHDENGLETTAMLDALSTNQTYFFREPRHFELLKRQVIPALVQRHESDRRLRLWSAGCSSGEEPYSIAITLMECVPDIQQWDVGILATDLSRRMLPLARAGLYNPERLRDTPPLLIQKYFTHNLDRTQDSYQVNASVRPFVQFACLNLMDHWPMRGQFDIIFCRNVMIYFDKPTQMKLIQRFWDILAPGGTLFVGHSESLAGIAHGFRCVQSAVYEKPLSEKD